MNDNLSNAAGMRGGARPGPAGALLRRCGVRLLRGLLPGCCALCGAGGDDTLCPDCAAQFFGADAARVPRCRCCANPLPTSGAESSPVRVPVPSTVPSTVPSPLLFPVPFPLPFPGPAPAPLPLPLPEPAPRGPPAAPQVPLCGQCSAQPPAFDVTLTAADYALPVDQLVLQLKFGHRLALAALFARLMRDAVLRQPGFILPALICPVPLGPRRLAERGYNQALEIARPLARSLGVALHPRLAVRVRDTTAQSSVAPEQRQRNIANAFALPDAALVRGRHVGLVDDVMTSGRTLNELAATLKRHGAARVSNLVFARTPPH